MSEFDKLDVAYFCHANEAHKIYLYWQKQRLRWWKQVGGVSEWVGGVRGWVGWINGASGWGQRVKWVR